MLAVIANPRGAVYASPMTLTNAEPLAVVRVGAWKLALPLRAVQQVFSAAMPTAVPSNRPTPAMAVRIGDELVPVAFAAALLGVEQLTMRPEDKMVLLDADGGRVVLWVDAVEEIVPYEPLQGRVEVPGADGGWVAGFSAGEHAMAVLDPSRLRAAAA